VEGQEQSVGPFKADILCKDITDDHYVLIENQLERTNHTHLGQLLTYAAGLHAVTIVWIADRFTDEHRAALDWLNAITSEEFRFFGLEIELWRIGESKIAPKFNIISKPNEWTADISRATRSIAEGGLTDTKKFQLEYWTDFRRYLEAKNWNINRKPRPQYWYTFAIGRSGFQRNVSFNTKQKFLRVSVNCRGPKRAAHFHLLKRQREAIEREFGSTLEWDELPDRPFCRIAIEKTDVDPSDRSEWPQQHRWLQELLEQFDRAFKTRIRALDASDLTSRRRMAMTSEIEVSCG